MKKWKSKLMLVMGFALIAATPPRAPRTIRTAGQLRIQFHRNDYGDGSASNSFGAVGRFTRMAPEIC